MAATGKTPILLYGSTTPTNAPTAGNLTNSSDGCEIAINVADKNLFFKDSTNAVNTVPIRQSSASSNGWLSSTDWTTFNGKAPSFTYTTGYIPFGQGTTTPTQDAALFWNNTSKLLGVGTSSPTTAIQVAKSNGSGTLSNLPYIIASNTIATANPYALAGVCAYTLNETLKVEMLADGTGVVTGAIGAGLFTRTNHPLIFGTNSTSRMTLDTSGNATIANGNLVIGTSGKGIDFSATAGTGTSELLADYEEGTWTPTDASGAGLTFTSASGRYTKIGRMVYIQGVVVYPTTTNASNSLIGGLPYSNTDDGGASRSGAFISRTNSTANQAITITTSFYPYASDARITNATMSTKTLYFGAFYAV